MFSSVCHCNPKIYFLFSYCYWLINILVTSFTEYGHMIWILFSFNTVSMHGCARAATFLPWLCQHLLPLTQPSYLSCYPSLILSCLPTSQSHDLKHFHFFFFFSAFWMSNLASCSLAQILKLDFFLGHHRWQDAKQILPLLWIYDKC